MNLILSDRSISFLSADNPSVCCVNLSELKIANCMGCFGCWTKTPGKCVIRDDAVRVYPLMAASSHLIYISRIRYGCYDSVMKTMLERAIPVQQPFIRLLDGETHHVQRSVVPKNATVIAYGASSAEEQDIFRRLVERNAKNMNFADYRIIFANEDEIETILRNEVEKWEK